MSRALKITALVVIAAVVVVTVVVSTIGMTTLKRWAYEEPGRDLWQEPARVIETLAIAPGDVIADIGSGGGYFAFRLAQATGPSGRVYACDIDEGLNDYVRDQAIVRGLENLEVIQADVDDPRLPESVDLVFSSDTVHHFDDPGSYFRRLHAHLKPTSRLAIVDYREPHMKALSKEELITAIEGAGYALLAEHDFLERQFFLVFGLK